MQPKAHLLDTFSNGVQRQNPDRGNRWEAFDMWNDEWFPASFSPWPSLSVVEFDETWAEPLREFV